MSRNESVPRSTSRHRRKRGRERFNREREKESVSRKKRSERNSRPRAKKKGRKQRKGRQIASSVGSWKLTTRREGKRGEKTREKVID